MSALTYNSEEGPEVTCWGRTLIDLQKKKEKKGTNQGHKQKPEVLSLEERVYIFVIRQKE